MSAAPPGGASESVRTAAGAVVLVAGHVCLDLVPELAGPPSLRPGDLWPSGPLTLAAGGCVANTGGVLAALGVPVVVSADVGDDAISAPLVDLVAGLGLDVSRLQRVPGSTSYSIVIQSPGIDRTFWHHVGVNDQFDGSAVRFADEAILHVGYPTLLPALVMDGATALTRLLRRAHAASVATSVDLAVVPTPTDGTRTFWGAVLRTVMPDVDVVTPSIDDLDSALTAGDPGAVTPERLLAAAERLVGWGAAIALVSGGSVGFGLATADAARFAGAGRLVAELSPEWHGIRLVAPAESLHPVGTGGAASLGTSGAGDAATAGLLAALLVGAGPEAAVAAAAQAAVDRITGVRGVRVGSA